MVFRVAGILVMWLLPIGISELIALDGQTENHLRSIFFNRRMLVALLGNIIVHSVFSFSLLGYFGLPGFLQDLVRGQATCQSIGRWAGVTALSLIAAVGIGQLIRHMAILNQGRRRQSGRISLRIRRVVLLLLAVGALPLLLCAGFSATSVKHLTLQEVCRKEQTVEGGKAYVLIKNEGTMPCKLQGLYLSTDEKALRAFRIPDQTIPAGETAVIEDAVERFVSLSKDGDTLYLSDAGGSILDVAELPALPVNTICRLDGDDWIRVPLPGSASDSGVSAPVFSVQGGFYDEAFSLSISGVRGDRVFYTLDGTVPDETCTEYTAPIRIENRSAEPNRFRSIRNVRENYLDYSPLGMEPVDKATIVRAVAVNSEGERSAVITETYFVGLDEAYREETVISLIADPEALFGINGIYVTGEAYDNWYAEKRAAEAAGKTYEEPMPTPNYLLRGSETEREANFEVYTNGERTLNQAVGIRVQGNTSRQNPLKRFSIYSRPMYSGSSLFDAPLFEGKRTHSVVLRQSLDNAISHNAAKGRDVAVLETRPVLVFLNGELWYHTYLQEKYTAAFFAETYGLLKSNVEFIAIGTWSKVSGEDRAKYKELIDFADSRDMSDPENYAALGQIADLQSYIDYACIQVYLANSDSHERMNTCIWRTKVDDHSEYGDGRWRWALYDMDLNKNNYRLLYGLDSSAELNSFTATREDGFPALLSGGQFYEALKRSPEFCRQFVVTFMDLANTTFSPEEMLPVLESLGTDLSYDHDFFLNRFRYLSAYLEEEFNLTGTQTELTLQTEQPEGGTIRLNTITPTLTEEGWTGIYYTDYPVSLTAQPADGHIFDHWEVNGERINEPTISVQLKEGGNTVYAVFR